MEKRIKEYTNKDGETLYKFQLYVGIDPQTGKQKKTRRQGFKTQKSAKLALSRLELEISKKGAIEQDNNILFKTVYEEWYPQYINTVRESTFRSTAGMFNNHILPNFGDKRIRTITIPQIQTVLNQWFKDTTYNYKKWYQYTVAIFDFALQRGYMDGTNPAKLITMPKKSDTPGDEEENFWTKKELEKFLCLFDKQKQIEKYTLFRLLIFTGVRRGELLALQWDDLNFADNTLRINKTLSTGLKGRRLVQAPKTKKGRRTIELDPITVAALKRWRVFQKRKYLLLGFNTMDKKQWLFSSRFNTPKQLNIPSKWLTEALRTTSLKPITIHGFRHSHASAMFAAGASIKDVQERLGHEDVQTTMNVYTHVTKEQHIEALDKTVNYLDF